MARIYPFFSSSDGNCTYIGGSGGGILIDDGVSARRTVTSLGEKGLAPADIGAIFVTHEHTDHTKGLKLFAGKNKIPVYASQGTLDAMLQQGLVTSDMDLRVADPCGTEICGMFVKPFRTPHDARESTGYTVLTQDSKRIAVATDFGAVTETIMTAIYGSDLVLIESNHDVGMLMNGPYPYHLKRRIISGIGHLSNENCSKAAVELLESGTTRFLLGHLSKDNNYPALALETTRAALRLAGAQENLDYILKIAGAADSAITL